LTIFSGYRFLGTSLVGIGLALFIVLLSIHNLRLNFREIATTILFAGYAIVVVVSSDEKFHIYQNLRYWYGVIFYIYMCKSYSTSKFITFRFFRFACFIFLLEALLINTIIESSLIHRESGELGHIFFGFYERPVGFAGNGGMTLVFLISYLYFVEIYRGIIASFFDLLLITCTVLLSVSTTAILVYVVYMLLKYATFNGIRFFSKIRSTILFVLLIIVPLTVIFTNTTELELQKYSYEYVSRLVVAKIKIVMTIDNYSFFGEQIYLDIPKTSSDFGLMVLIITTGVVGFCLYFLILFVFNNFEYKYLPVLFLIHFGSLHYPSAFSPAGHLLTAMILIVRDNSYFRQAYLLKVNKFNNH
jgi:hypothetical protein